VLYLLLARVPIAARYQVRLWFEAPCPAFANPRPSICPVEECTFPIDPMLRAVCRVLPNLTRQPLHLGSGLPRKPMYCSHFAVCCSHKEWISWWNKSPQRVVSSWKLPRGELFLAPLKQNSLRGRLSVWLHGAFYRIVVYLLYNMTVKH